MSEKTDRASDTPKPAEKLRLYRFRGGDTLESTQVRRPRQMRWVNLLRRGTEDELAAFLLFLQDANAGLAEADPPWNT